MKNIYKTILVWLLTAVIGSTVIWAMRGIDELKSSGSFDWNGKGIMTIATSGGVICLTISIPAMIIYHFLAVSLYSSWRNVAAIKLALCCYVMSAIFTTTFVLGACVNDSYNPVFYKFSVPYMFAACLLVLLFRYRPLRKQSLQGESISQSSN